MEPRLLPPDPSVSGTHVIGQDSAYKGCRLVDAVWNTDGFWKTMGFRYPPTLLARSGWTYVAEGSLLDNGITDASETIVGGTN